VQQVDEAQRSRRNSQRTRTRVYVVFARRDRDIANAAVGVANGDRHLGCVNATTEIFIAAFKGRAVTSGQNPVQLSDFTEPQPDIVLLKPRKDFYRGKRPETADAILVVEVSDTTLAYDRDVKLSHYAAAGIPEVWNEDLNSDRIVVFLNAVDGVDLIRLVLGREESISVQVFPDTVFTVSDFLG